MIRVIDESQRSAREGASSNLLGELPSRNLPIDVDDQHVVRWRDEQTNPELPHGLDERDANFQRMQQVSDPLTRLSNIVEQDGAHSTASRCRPDQALCLLESVWLRRCYMFGDDPLTPPTPLRHVT